MHSFYSQSAKSLQSCPTVRPHRWQPTRLPRPWDSPGKNTGVGCHFLLQCMKVKRESEVAQLCPTLGDPMDCSLPGSSVHGIFQARVLKWGAIAFSDSQSTQLEILILLLTSCVILSYKSPCCFSFLFYKLGIILTSWVCCENYVNLVFKDIQNSV